MEGINLNLPHLPHQDLVYKLHRMILETNVVLLAAPAGHEKTSLLTLLAHRYPEFRYVFINVLESEQPTAILTRNGLDLFGGRVVCSIPADKPTIFLLDDCQRQYANLSFWEALLKSYASQLPSHVRFVLSATHLLEDSNPESPVMFRTIMCKLTRQDFVISDDESEALLKMENGLRKELQYPTLMKIIVRECRGHVGALRCAVDMLYWKLSTTREEVALQFYFSVKFVEPMARCFADHHTPPRSIFFQQFLTKCLARDPTVGPVSLLQLSQEETLYRKRLMRAGIITTDDDGLV